MRRFDLGMSINYCPQWGVVEAIREFFQNAYDAQTLNAENEMYFNYDRDTYTLQIGNENGLLNTDSLLLGNTNKADDDRTIGKHGEGYKVATVVLCRLGKQVRIYNRSKNEVWTAKVVKSRRYNADIVVFDIERFSLFKSPADKDLVFEVKGVLPHEYDQIVKSNLHLQDLCEGVDFVNSAEGRILLGKRFAGQLFVGGLYVTTSKNANMGYDFNPVLVKLDRDRSFIDGLDLQFLCGKLISATNDIDFIRSVKNTWDGNYLRFFLSSYCKSDYLKLYDEAFSDFVAKHGKDAIPTTSTSEFNQLKRNGFNAVMVNDADFHFITNAKNYESSVIDEGKSDTELADALESWFHDNISSDLKGYDEGLKIITQVLCRLRV